MTRTARQKREAKFHDAWAEAISEGDLFYKESFTSPTAIENRYILKIMGSLKGKRILDLGCGLGDASIFFAKKGARVDAIDISPKMVDIVQKFAKKESVTKLVKAQTMPAEKLDFPDNSFDFVYGNGVLHHVDFLTSGSEINRVLKNNGRAFFIEPLSYNPIINIYRKIASKVRTRDETPLSFHDISSFGSLFSRVEHEEFHLLTQLIFIWFFVAQTVSPNKERYWKKIIVEGQSYKRVFVLLNSFDVFLLRHFPFLRRSCWNSVIIVHTNHEQQKTLS